MPSLDKPRVIILSAFLTPFRSGAEACAEEVALRLCDEYDITIVTARLRRDAPRHDLLKGKVKVVRVGFGCGCDKWLYPAFAPCVVRSLSAQGAPAGRPYTQGVVIHAILETFAGLALHFCRFTVPQAKRILTCQTTNRNFLKGMIVRSPHLVTAISSALKHIAESFGRKDVTVIPNGIDLAAIRSACEKHAKVPGRILFVGRLERMKGVDVLLTAFAKFQAPNSKSQTNLKSQIPNSRNSVHLRVVGGGSERRYLEQLAHDLGIADRVTFTGFIPVPDVYEEFAKAEIFCGLSRSEALGNVFLEAQAAGCAVIATKVGGIVDIVSDADTGILVESDDALQASTALKRLLDDDHCRQSIARAGMVHAQAYSWDRISNLYRDIYLRQ